MAKIENLRLIYDKDTDTFIKAYALIDGRPLETEDDKTIDEIDQEIRELIEDFKKQENVSKLNQADKDKYSLSNPNSKSASGVYYADLYKEEYRQLADEYVSKITLNRENEYDEQEIYVEPKKLSKLQKMVISGGIIVTAIATVVGCAMGKTRANNQEEPEETKNEIVNEVVEKVTKEKVNPESWDKYVSDYAESMQKNLLTGEMDQITSNIVKMNINNKEYKLAISPAEMTSLNYYYNTFDMSNDDMLRTYGLYNLDQENGEDLINNVHDGLNKIRLSLVKATKADDVLRFKINDEVSQKLFNKYADLMVKYNNADKKSDVKKEIEDAFRVDFIENGSVDLKEHPASTIVLQVIPSAMNLKLDPINEKLNIILVGTETNYKVDGVENSIQQNGLVDSACSVIDRRLVKFDDYREELNVQKENDDNYNELLKLQKAAGQNINIEYKISKFDELTEETYDLSNVMIPLMNDYLSKNFDLAESIDYDNMNEEITKEMVSELQQKQLNNDRKWDLKNNPSGGKVGDEIKGETVKGVKVTESELSKTTSGKQQMEQAKQEYINNNTDGVVADATNKEQIAKIEQQIVTDYTALCKEAYSAGQSETISQGANAPVNSKYANHQEAVVRNAYNEGRSNGIRVYNETHGKNNTVTPINQTEEQGVGEHKTNPNQNGSNQSTPTPSPVVENVVTEQQPVQENTTVVTPINDNAGTHQDNPNQNQTPVVESYGTVNIESFTTYIPGTETLDATGVEDMSQYGEVMDESVKTR